MESAQFELHLENVSPETNKLYVVSASVVGTTGEATGEETKGEANDEEAVGTTGEANDEADGGTTSKAIETSVSVLTSTYTEVSHLVKVLNQTLENAGHKDIVFSYVRAHSRIQVTVAGKTLRLKKDSPSLILGLGEIAAGKSWKCSGEKAGVVKALLYAEDLSAGRRAVLLQSAA